MRILHVGSGFRPFRWGGLVAYVEDLIDEQVQRGHEVTYFFSGRQYPLARRPRLRRWERRGARMLEVINSPLYDHGRQPELELSEPAIERMLERAIRDSKPEVVHVQELAGLPSSVLEVARRLGRPTVVTLQDYFPVCSTFRLLDSEGRVCLRREIGEDCVATTAADPRPPGLLIEGTIEYHLMYTPRLHRLERSRLHWWLHDSAPRWGAREANRRKRRAPGAAPTAAAYQRRREVNLERLNGAERVIAMSHRVAELYERLGLRSDRVRTIHLTLAHIDELTPRRMAAAPPPPVTFATLAGFQSEAKGARLLIDAMRLLADRVRDGRLRLLVFGFVDPRFEAAAADTPGIEVRAPFIAEWLDAILDEVDVGLMPSVWEEAYGYAGLEFLAKGIPVIANAIGGMPDYTREGETGWLNHSLSASELAGIMGRIADRPEQVAELNGKLIEARESLVKAMSRHADEMDAVYADAMRMRSG